MIRIMILLFRSLILLTDAAAITLEIKISLAFIPLRIILLKQVVIRNTVLRSIHVTAIPIVVNPHDTAPLAFGILPRIEDCSQLYQESQFLSSVDLAYFLNNQHKAFLFCSRPH